MATTTATAGPHSGKWYRHLYVQVLCAIALGVLLGHFYPSIGAQMKPLGDAFIKLIKMLIAPIIFCTVVHGIASMEDMKKVGRVGLKALLYFEVDHHAGAGHRADRRQSVAARRRHERRPDALDTKAIADLHRQGRASRAPSTSCCTSSRPPSSAPSPRARSCRCCSSRSCSPSRCTALGERGKPLLAPHRPDRARLLRHRRHRHEGGADRRLRRHGVHHRQVRRRHAALARLADAGASTPPA